jgi:hypothetical protein
MTLSITTICNECNFAECHYAECHMLSVVAPFWKATDQIAKITLG